jgi:hypothetical protein
MITVAKLLLQRRQLPGGRGPQRLEQFGAWLADLPEFASKIVSKGWYQPIALPRQRKLWPRQYDMLGLSP